MALRTARKIFASKFIYIKNGINPLPNVRGNPSNFLLENLSKILSFAE